MQYTERCQLKKPEATDDVNIEDLNDNMDIIDPYLANVPATTGLAGQVITATEDGVAWGGMLRWELVAEITAAAGTHTYKIPAGIPFGGTSRIMAIPEGEAYTEEDYFCFTLDGTLGSSWTLTACNCPYVATIYHNEEYLKVAPFYVSNTPYVKLVWSDEANDYVTSGANNMSMLKVVADNPYIFKIYLERLVTA